MTNEIWKDIEGYTGLYQVSNLGRIKSLPRTIASGIYYSNIRTTDEIIKSTTVSNAGYELVALYKGNKEKRFTVHRLVAEAFIPNPHNLPQVNHKDENKLNNNCGNLEWCTRKYNANYGTSRQRLSDIRKIPVIQLDENDTVVCRYEFVTEVRKNNFDPSGVIQCCKGRRENYRGFRWRYADD